MKKLYLRAAALLLSAALMLTAVGCSVVEKPAASQSPAPTATAAPSASAQPTAEPSAEVTPEPSSSPLLGGITVDEFDDAQLTAVIDDIYAAVEKEDAEAEVLELYDNLVDELSRYYDASTMAQLNYYLDPTDEEKSQKNSDYEYMSTDIGDRVSLAVAAILNSPYEDALSGHIDNAKVLDLKSYEGMDDYEKGLYDQETALELQYDDYYTKVNDLEVTVDNRKWTWSLFLEVYQELEYDTYVKIYKALCKNENQLLGGTLLDLVKVRNEIAVYNGYDNYYDMAWVENFGRDYEYQDFLTIRDYAIEYLSGVSTDLGNAGYGAYYSGGDGIDWDVSDYFDRLSEYDAYPSKIREALTYFADNDLLVIGDDGCYESSYTTQLYTLGIPFIYHSNYNAMYDVTCLSHETGHAINAYFSTMNALDDSFQAIDVCEIQSNAFELMSMDMVSDMYPEQADEMKIMMLNDVVGTLFSIGIQTEIEYMLYTTEDLTLAKANNLAGSIVESYGQSTDFPGVYYWWSEIPHYSFSAGYVVSYVTSAAAALAIWYESTVDFDAAMEKYVQIVQLDSRSSFYETVENYGLTDIFCESFYKELADCIEANYLG